MIWNWKRVISCKIYFTRLNNSINALNLISSFFPFFSTLIKTDLFIFRYRIPIKFVYGFNTYTDFFHYFNFRHLFYFWFRYILRPSPFSAQKTFERHNSRRKSNISFNSTIGQLGFGGSRRGSTMAFPPFMTRPPPLVTTKANSLSLPDSPTVGSALRARSNSLRVVDDILLRRSNSLRQGLCNRKSSLEELGVSHFPIGSIAHERRPSMQVSLSARSMRNIVTARRRSEVTL